MIYNSKYLEKNKIKCWIASVDGVITQELNPDILCAKKTAFHWLSDEVSTQHSQQSVGTDHQFYTLLCKPTTMLV